MLILVCLLFLDDDDTASSSGASDTEGSKVHEDDILRQNIIFDTVISLSCCTKKY